MDAQKRAELIEEYGRGYDNLLACLEEIPQEIWQFKPEPAEWSVHEIIIHLADSETNSALRARMLITQPGGSLMAYDQGLWAETLNYHSQNWELALEGLKWARETTCDLIKGLPEATWEHAVKHPEFEQPYTFDLWLEIYAAHIPGHIEQIKNNHEIWQDKQ
ncbi:DinB family protein [Chloroflexota bacterium]